MVGAATNTDKEALVHFRRCFRNPNLPPEKGNKKKTLPCWRCCVVTEVCLGWVRHVPWAPGEADGVGYGAGRVAQPSSPVGLPSSNSARPPRRCSQHFHALPRDNRRVSLFYCGQPSLRQPILIFGWGIFPPEQASVEMISLLQECWRGTGPGVASTGCLLMCTLLVKPASPCSLAFDPLVTPVWIRAPQDSFFYFFHVDKDTEELRAEGWSTEPNLTPRPPSGPTL